MSLKKRTHSHYTGPFALTSGSMDKQDLYNCKIEKSPINGNYTVWLPEQDCNDYVDFLEEKYELNQGSLWELLLKTASKEKNLDTSSVYFEPEGNVFVAYTSSYDLSISMASILNELISNIGYLQQTVRIYELNK